MDLIAQSRGVSLSQIAINWSTQKDYIDTAICGVSKLRHVEENCSATNWTLTPEELALLDRAIETLEENVICPKEAMTKLAGAAAPPQTQLCGAALPIRKGEPI